MKLKQKENVATGWSDHSKAYSMTPYTSNSKCPKLFKNNIRFKVASISRVKYQEMNLPVFFIKANVTLNLILTTAKNTNLQTQRNNLTTSYKWLEFVC